MTESDKQYWRGIEYEGLSEYENLLIAEARITGFAEFFAAYPDAKSQGQSTLKAAREFNFKR